MHNKCTNVSKTNALKMDQIGFSHSVLEVVPIGNWSRISVSKDLVTIGLLVLMNFTNSEVILLKC